MESTNAKTAKFADVEPRLALRLARRLEEETLAIDELEQLGALTPELVAFREANRSLLKQLDTAIIALAKRSDSGA